MRHTLLISALAISAICISCKCETESEYSVLTKQAAQEYLVPIRQGGVDGNPYWNTYSKRFLFAPAFDFAVVEGAKEYLYTVTSEEDSSKQWSFKASTPNECLAPVWNDIEVGRVILKVEGIDASGNVLGIAGERSFMRNFPFNPPYSKCTRSYGEAARLCLVGIHRQPYVQAWLTQDEPDMSYFLYTYPSKIVSGLIRIETLLAKEMPQYKDEAIAIAEKCAKFLVSISQDETGVFPYFPPTYYGGIAASGEAHNQGKAMFMEPIYFGEALLDLYDVTGNEQYLEKAHKLSETYVKAQREDGSLPVKVDFSTGEPVNNVSALLEKILSYWRRLERNYSVTDCHDSRILAEKWMKENPEKTFNWNGQFEDWTVVGVKPYQNFTGCTCAPYASYLLTQDTVTEEDILLSTDIVNMIEDQLVNWDFPVDKELGFKTMMTPCCFEQFNDDRGIDSSADILINAWLNIYNHTGDKLMFAKAQAMADGVLQCQNYFNGIIPTTMEWWFNEGNNVVWLNCTYNSILTMMRMQEELDKLQ